MKKVKNVMRRERISSPDSQEWVKAAEAHQKVYFQRKTNVSHQAIAAAAAYEAAVRQGGSQGQVAEMAASQVAQLAQQYQWSGPLRDEITRQARAAANEYRARVHGRGF